MSNDRAADGASACRNIAVLFDSDNAEPALASAVLAEVARFGVAVVRRAYGDWTEPNMASWKPAILAEAIHPMQQFRFTKGKNATDCAMIIDAMDLLHSGRFQGFVLVSSDSDFSGLARRIREEALLCIGFGKRKTPPAFVAACDRFVHTELLARKPEQAVTSGAATKQVTDDPKLIALLTEAAQAALDDTGWAHLGAVGTKIRQLMPTFDARSWGFSKLSKLVAAIPVFEVEERPVGGASGSLCIRRRSPRRSAGRGPGSSGPTATPTAFQSPAPCNPPPARSAHS